MFLLENKIILLRKLIARILVAVLGVGYSLGLNFDVQGVHYKLKSYLLYSFYDSTYKVGKKEFLRRVPSYDIKLAKNEYEACQIVVRSRLNSAQSKFKIEFSDFVNENGDKLDCEIFEEKYIPCISDKNYGTFPDALVELSENPYVFVPGCQINHPFYIRVHADKGTPAGVYKAQIKATDEKGKKIEFIANMTASVWDFTLPETPSCETAFGISKYCLETAYYTSDDPVRTQKIYKDYYDCLLEHGISAYDLPYDILSPEADAYMSDPRVTSFLIPYINDDAKLQEYYAKVQSNPEWAKKGFFYPIDEPCNIEAYKEYAGYTERLKKLCPGYHMVTPLYTEKIEDNGKIHNALKLQADSDIVCPLSELYSSNEFIEQIKERRADGSKIWWYVCCGPKGKYCNIFTHWDGIKGRLLLWQQKSVNVNGLLYWSTTYWKDVMSPWADALTTPWTGNDSFGDGSLFYPGKDGKPVVTLRLEEISDGIDDFEYLTIAEKLFGREYVDKKIAKLSKNLTDYTLKDSRLVFIRGEIGKDIEKQLKGNK